MHQSQGPQFDPAASPQFESAAGKGTNAREDIMFRAATKESHAFWP